MMCADFSPEYRALLTASRQQDWRRVVTVLAALALAVTAGLYAGLFDPSRYQDVWRPISTLAADAMPPDFSRWRHWGRPLLETLSMSIAGTLIGLLAALPLGALAARNIGGRWPGQLILLFLNTLRSVPGLVWGVIFVAALGFGPLPGVMALACHSTGMLGKFCAEMLEHLDAGPGDALRAQGVGAAGVFRFAVWPQLLPRLVDITLYRWEHNLRAATTLGVVGAGGLGLEIITAFHLFEYQEALALILVLLALVSLLNLFGAWLRWRLLGGQP